MTVHFIGAGPGAPDLITVRGQNLVARCPVCLFAGSLVPREIIALCPPGARVIDTRSEERRVGNVMVLEPPDLLAHRAPD